MHSLPAESPCVPPGLRAPRLLRLLRDGAVVLGLILRQRRVRLGEQDRSTPQGSLQQEPARGHQVAVALGVGEGVARAAGADAPGGRAAGRRSGQRLLLHLVPHLEGEKDRHMSQSFHVDFSMWRHLLTRSNLFLLIHFASFYPNRFYYYFNIVLMTDSSTSH